MLERDWRIFREDHSIGYKGSIDKTCLPIRNWKEANLPSSLMKVCAPASFTTSLSCSQLFPVEEDADQ